MLPSTIKKEASEDANAPESSSYKKKKESKDKALKCNREYMGKDARTVAGALAVSYSVRSR